MGEYAWERKKGREKEDTPKFYDVGRFKEIVGNTPAPLSILRSLELRLVRLWDSLIGNFGTFFSVAIRFVSPIIIVFSGVILGPFAFLASLLDIMGVVGLYVRRRLGNSMQLGDYNLLLMSALSTLCFFLVITSSNLRKLP